MKRALLAIALAGCVDASDPPWQLRHERVVAVRAEPAGVAEGEVALLDGLLSHPDGTLTDEQPVAVVVQSPRELFTAVHYNIDHWQIDGVQVAAPTLLEIEMRFAGGEVATKLVMVGEHIANPVPPAVPAAALHQTIELPEGTWLTDCGTITGARWRVDEACDGHLVGVVRRPPGIAWTVGDVHVP